MGVDLYNAYQEKITWTNEQEACLKYAGKKTLLVKGVAGGGKSLVIQALAKKLLEGYTADKKNKVAVFTFCNTLNSATKEFLKINGDQEDYITVTTLTSYIMHVYKAMGVPKCKVYPEPYQTDLKKEIVKEALQEYKKKNGPNRLHNLELEFWVDEFNWMKNMNISVQDLEQYLHLPRKGRNGKVRLTQADRQVVFQVFTYFDNEMKKRGTGDWADQSLYLVRNADKIPDSYKFDHILIDEAQDLSLVQMMAAMMFFRKDMVVAMDMNQRLYDTQWTPKLLGIETATKKLTKSMRTTRQIDDLAESVRQKNEVFLEEEEKSVRVIPERQGHLPELVRLESIEAEKKYVTKLVQAYLAQNSKHSIGIIASRNRQIKTYAAWMTDAGIRHEIIEKESTFSMATPGVKIVNTYNAKGLEFTRVIIPQFIEGNFPYNFRTDDEEEKQQFLAKSRNLVYVSMTRAQHTLVLTYCGEKGSRFIGEMDPQCYTAKGLPIVYDSGTGTGTGRKSKDKKIELPPTAPVTTKIEEGKTMKDYFQEKGLEVIDKRSAGGALWIVGEKEKLLPYVKEAGKLFGAYGQFSAKGGRATKNRPGWFTNCKK